MKSLDLHASCFMTKPVEMERSPIVARALDRFWSTVVKRPLNEAS